MPPSLWVPMWMRASPRGPLCDMFCLELGELANPVEIENKEYWEDINSVLWALRGLTSERSHLCEALSDFKIAMDILYDEEDWIQEPLNKLLFDWIEEAYEVIYSVSDHIDHHRERISRIFDHWGFIPHILAEDLPDDGNLGPWWWHVEGINT